MKGGASAPKAPKAPPPGSAPANVVFSCYSRVQVFSNSEDSFLKSANIGNNLRELTTVYVSGCESYAYSAYKIIYSLAG